MSAKKKIKNIRNQFSVENAKVKASLRSGTGTDDVYIPNLWYYSALLFLDTYVTPRKRRNSLDQNPVSASSTSPIYMSESQTLPNGLDSPDQQLNTDQEDSYDIPNPTIVTGQISP